MKQSEWKDQIESIEKEMLRLGKDHQATPILRQFGTRLSTTIHHFFSEAASLSPDQVLTVEQQAFMHSLQLYDLHSVIRLIGNYDASKGLKVVLPGIEKSYRSLMVIQKLERFTKNSIESTALDSYKFRLEEALSRVLKCRREDLYQEDILAEKVVLVSGASDKLIKKFFTERLRTLFSTNYRAYLMLKNRYFLHRLKQFRKNPKNYTTLYNYIKKLTPQIKINKESMFDQILERLDFRQIEILVKSQVLSPTEKVIAPEKTIPLNSKRNSSEKILAKLESVDENSTTQEASHYQTRNKLQISFESSVKEQSKDESNNSYEKLCATYSYPLEKLSDSFSPVPECSSPYFRSRVEEYCLEFANFFQQLLQNGNLKVVAACHNFTQELLIQRGHEYKAAERWGVVSKNKKIVESVYFRSSDDKLSFIDRKAEWSMMIRAKLPFELQLPLENIKSLEIEKNHLCIFQIGTAFFDQEYKNKTNEYPDVFFKLMFGGNLLSEKNSVIYVEEDPFFTTTLEQMWSCRGLVYLFLIAISHRFAIEFSPSLKNFLVEVLPSTILVSGEIPLNQ